MSDIRAAMTAAVMHAVKLAGDSLPDDLRAQIDALKTANYYRRQTEWAAGQLYRERWDIRQWETYMLDLMDDQLTRAWAEGMAKNGLDPKADLTPAMSAELQRIKIDQVTYISKYGQDIEQARLLDSANGTPRASLPALQARSTLWGNSYNDILNQAVEFTAEPKDRYEWMLGPTEHCDTCMTLAGTVASGDEWRASGWRPQSRDLACHGYNCQCQLVPTTRRRSRNRFNKFEAARSTRR